MAPADGNEQDVSEAEDIGDAGEGIHAKHKAGGEGQTYGACAVAGCNASHDEQKSHTCQQRCEMVVGECEREPPASDNHKQG